MNDLDTLFVNSEYQETNVQLCVYIYTYIHIYIYIQDFFLILPYYRTLIISISKNIYIYIIYLAITYLIYYLFLGIRRVD
jgi:hypothetical protein